jgi:hypothetical protein
MQLAHARGLRRLGGLILQLSMAACAGSMGSGDRYAVPAGSGSAQGMTFEISYTNLTTGQRFSPSVFMTHNAGAPHFFQVGQPASFGLMRIAEEGNSGPLLSADVVPMLGQAFGSAMTAISTLPGQTRVLRITADAAHPMLSGGWMLVMTNDGFTGIDGLDLRQIGASGRTMDLNAYDAGTERNNERSPFLIAKMGTERDPENGRVGAHPGIRGDADAPADWKFTNPVARITIRRVQ